MPVSPARPKLSPGISQTTRQTTYELFTPSKSGQRSHPTYYRGCWHVVSRCFLSRYRHQKASSLAKGVYNPKAVIPHAASLHQACAHCAIFPTAASRRSLGRISVPMWPVRPLRPATRRRLGRPLPHQQADRPRAHPTPKKLSTTDTKRWSYPVLDPVSQAYPEVQGRSPTCYSPVRHSSTQSKL